MPFPTTPILDNFNYAGPLLNGSWWSTPVFSGNLAPRVVGNQVGPDTDSGNSYTSALWLTGFTSNKREVWMTVGTVASARREFYVDISAPNSLNENMYALAETFATATEWGIYVCSGGGFTLLGTVFTQAYALGDAFGLECESSVTFAQKAYYKASGGSWVQVGATQADSNYFSGQIGFALQENVSAPRMDDFGGGDAVAALPTPAVAPDYRGFPRYLRAERSTV